MKESEIAKVSEMIRRKIDETNLLAYLSVEWLILFGAAQGIEEIMIELGYEWNGSEFVEV